MTKKQRIAAQLEKKILERQELDKRIEELEKTTLKKTAEIDEDFDKALQAAEDEFKDVDLSFSVPKPEKKEEKEKEKDEA